MSFLTASELETHLYKENIDAITRDDETILTASIDAACIEAKGYLSAFDTQKIFSSKGDERNALLLIFIKDIAVWHFINLCNAGTELELRQDRYNRAVAWLKSVQRGEVIPDLPLRDITGDGNEDANPIYIFGSNPKRSQHF